MTVSWNGRACVCESKLTQEQYDVFFEHGPYNIKFDIANLILSKLASPESSEVVPCDELVPEVRNQIAFQMHLCDCGTVTRRTADGKLIELHWAWNPTFTDDDGEEIDDVPSYVLDKIIYEMLENQSVCGIVDY